MNAHAKPQPYFIGQPVLHSDACNHRQGWIAEVADQPRGVRVSIIGAQGLEEQHHRLTIVWDDGTFSEDLSEGIAGRWIAEASRSSIEPLPADAAADALHRAKAKRAEDHKRRQAEAQAAREELSAWRDSIRDKIPSDAKAVIIGELEIDDCDSMTDYFNTKTTRQVILGFSKHTRDIFSELRKAARNCPETAQLADAPAEAEHREKHSMGAGYYLKDGNRYSTGWAVRKRPFYNRGNDIAENMPRGEWFVPEKPAAQPRAERARPTEEAQAVAEGFTLSEHTHDKKGFRMWVVVAAARVERETFMSWLGTAKSLGGWYSRKWKATPAGFAFKSEEAARSFIEQIQAEAV